LEHKVGLEALIAVLEEFRAGSDVQTLPSSPEYPIRVLHQPDRPQPLRDRDAGQGMAVSIGRLRPCTIFDYKFVLLGHNTVRGAAGGSIHNAELLVSQGWI
jgi:aspartate-semialdehyde dehydrogenase